MLPRGLPGDMVDLGGWGGDAGGLCVRLVWLLRGGVYSLQVRMQCCFLAVVCGVERGVYGCIGRRFC